MRAFLTGGTGFVGRHVAELFVRRGWQVCALARRGADVSGLREAGATVHEGFLLQPDSYAEAVAGCEAVVHCAGAIRALNLAGYLAVNADGARAVAETAARSRVPRFVLVSSIAARGPLPEPAPEAGHLGLSPHPSTALRAGVGEARSGKPDRGGGTSPGIGPVSNYGRSKLAGEEAVAAVAGSMQVAILRPPPVYGPHDHGMLPVFRMAGKGWFPVFGRGLDRIGMVHGADVADAIRSLVELPGPMPAGPFYPEDGSNPTWVELAQYFSAALGRRARVIPLPAALFRVAGGLGSAWAALSRRPVIFSLDKVREMAARHWQCDSGPLREATGWKPAWELTAGLAETWKWYRDRRWV